MKSALKFVLMLVVTAGAWVGIANGQLNDPTRPPGAVQGGAAGADGTGGDAQSGVQAVFIRPGGGSAALVNGQMLHVGDKLADKKVIKITETEIVLSSEGGRETMKLIPDVTKTPHKSTAAQPAVGSAGRRPQ